MCLLPNYFQRSWQGQFYNQQFTEATQPDVHGHLIKIMPPSPTANAVAKCRIIATPASTSTIWTASQPNELVAPSGQWHQQRIRWIKGRVVSLSPFKIHVRDRPSCPAWPEVHAGRRGADSENLSLWEYRSAQSPCQKWQLSFSMARHWRKLHRTAACKWMLWEGSSSSLEANTQQERQMRAPAFAPNKHLLETNKRGPLTQPCRELQWWP